MGRISNILAAGSAICAGMMIAAPASALTYAANFDGNNGTYGRIVTPTGSFSDDVTFTLATGGVASFDVTSILASGDQTTNLDFTSVLLNGVTAFTIASTGDRESRFLLNTVVSAGTNFIRLIGTTGGNASYSGTIAFSPIQTTVPEPATWALMFVGFGLVGASIRRRSTRMVLS